MTLFYPCGHSSAPSVLGHISVSELRIPSAPCVPGLHQWPCCYQPEMSAPAPILSRLTSSGRPRVRLVLLPKQLWVLCLSTLFPTCSAPYSLPSPYSIWSLPAASSLYPVPHVPVSAPHWSVRCPGETHLAMSLIFRKLFCRWVSTTYRVESKLPIAILFALTVFFPSTPCSGTLSSV